MYRFSPSAYLTSAIRQDRFGSYSTATTVAGPVSFSRRKSMSRYILRAPPPRWRAVILPWLFRPPVRVIRTINDFSGRFFLSVISAKSATDASRRPGLVGL